jgi:hypothetical protein
VTTNVNRRITGNHRRVDLYALACEAGGTRFENTHFEDVHFIGSFSSETVAFKNCRGSIVFDGGGPVRLRFIDCGLDYLALKAELQVEKLTMRNSCAEKSEMRDIVLEDLDLKEVDLPNLISRHVRFPRRGRLDWPAFVRLWFSPKSAANGNTVRLPGAERSPFVDFLRLEYKLDLILKEAKLPHGKRGSFMDLPRRLSVTFVPFVLLLTTKLGMSLWRLFITSIVALAAGTAVIAASAKVGFASAFQTVVALLLNRDGPVTDLPPGIELGLSGIGLLLFALLIAVISNRFLNS